MIEKLRTEEQQLQWVKNHQGLIEKIDEKTKLISMYDHQLKSNRIEQETQVNLIQQLEKIKKETLDQVAEMTILKEKVSTLQFQIPLYEEKEKVASMIEKIKRS